MKRSVVLGVLLLFLLSGLFVGVQEWRQDEPSNIGTSDGSAAPDESPSRRTNTVTSYQGISHGESQTSQATGIPPSAECEGFVLPGGAGSDIRPLLALSLARNPNAWPPSWAKTLYGATG